MPSLRQTLFQYRSYTPVPFLAVMVIFAQPTPQSLIAGGILVLAGEGIRLWGVAYAGSLTRVISVGAPSVVISGPFAHVRNPLYAGNIVMYAGIGIMSNALAPWLTILALGYFSFQYAMIVLHEEEFLEKEFGAAYLEFKKNVPRFFPRFKKYEHPAQSSQTPNWTEALRSERRTFQALGGVGAVLLVLWFRGT